MQEVYKAIGRVAPQDVTVLILGESGSGKELVARAIYHHSRRADKRFLAVNCAALTETLLESELFGHEKRIVHRRDRRQRIGKFEQCSGGTLFLDEVGDMSLSLQSKVLRVLQEQRFERVGGTETVHTDVRIITATNRNLEKMVADGEFREDLYYRLNGFTIKLPPLRDRKNDLVILLERFLGPVPPGTAKRRARHFARRVAIAFALPLAGKRAATAKCLAARHAACHRTGVDHRILSEGSPLRSCGERIGRNDAGRASAGGNSPARDLQAFVERAVAGRFDESLCRVAGNDGAASAFDDHANDARKSLQSRGDPRNHPRQRPQ